MIAFGWSNFVDVVKAIVAFLSRGFGGTN